MGLRGNGTAEMGLRKRDSAEMGLYPHCFTEESHRNLALEANGSDLIVLIRNLIGI